MNLDRVRSAILPPVEQVYDVRDTILYALGVGYGDEPTDWGSLGFVYERQLRVLPSYCVALASSDSWLRDPALDIDYSKVVHGEQSFRVHRPLTPTGKVRATFRVLGVEDKGREKGALLSVEKTLWSAGGFKLADVAATLFLRGDGGQGGFGEIPRPPTALPEGPPARTIDLCTVPQLALIYRLSGDMNPLHADPHIALQAGFQRPILHGLCTLGIACRAIVQMHCGGDPDRLQAMFARFSAPVYPGETIRVETYTHDGAVRFRARAVDRDVVVLDRGEASMAA